MRKINCFLMILALIVTFAGCNQKEKKIAKIIDGITEEQMGEINKIVAASWNLDADKVVFDIGYTHDTIYISCYDTCSIESPDRDLQKDFLFAALCSNSPETEGLLAQIAAVPAVLLFAYADDVSHTLDLTETNPNEIKEALVKDYTPKDVLNSYTDLMNENSDRIKLSIEENNFVVTIYDNDYNIDSYVDSMKSDALSEGLLGIFNWDNIENMISEDLQEEANELCYDIIGEFSKHQPYILKEIIKANLGFELRLSAEDAEKGVFARCDNNRLKIIKETMNKQ